MVYRSRWFWALVIVTSGCAVGGDGTDAGASMDADVDSAIGDSGAVDASTMSDAADSAMPMIDAGEDAGVTGPIACTPATAGVCGTRPCVDGFCCDQPCDTACRNCGIAGSEGTCTLHGAGTDPDSECADEAPSTCGTTGTCDATGACMFHDTSVTCDDAMSCTTGDVCDGAGMCRGAAPADCTPAAGNECCLGSCDASGCTTDPGSCADICGGNMLTTGRSCMGCGAARAAGSCLGGAIQVCDAASNSQCQQVTCGGTTYFCTNTGGSWSWRASAVCDDTNACTFNDVCGSGICGGTSVTCTSSVCMTRTCNGSSACTETPNAGVPCDDSMLCTYGDACSSLGTCVPAGTVTCTSTMCLDRTCNGTANCTDTPRTGMVCDDSNLCTTGETCSVGGVCQGGTTVTCPPDTTCLAYTCDGSPTCASTPQNVGGVCDDGDPLTPVDVCQADGTCLGLMCTPTLTSVFSDNFSTPSSSSWTNGTDVPVNTSQWNAYTTSRHGVRITSNRLEMTNERSGSADHGGGFAYVRTDGVGSDYDNTTFASTLSNNTGHDVVWSFNMRRDDPDTTDGGFDCTSSGSQNGRMVGLAYVLASSGVADLAGNASTCSASGTANGYAVIFGGDNARLRLVRFASGLRNGALTTIVLSNAFSRTNYFSVRVTYNADTDGWRLEARSDGSSSFSDPSTGTFSSTGTGTDSTYVGVALDYSGPYFQAGCCCLCNEVYTARFDSLSVGIRCAGG